MIGWIIFVLILMSIPLATYELRRRRHTNICNMNNDVDFDDWKGTEFRESEDREVAVPIKLENV